MISIMLPGGHVTLIDDIDEDLCFLYWCAKPSGLTTYARRSVYPGKGVWLHRTIAKRMFGDALKFPMSVDHINGNGLDNRRSNLRLATPSEQGGNVGKCSRNTSSKYKGVTWDKNAKRWKARIKKNQIYTTVGLFRSELDAAKAYDRAALEYFGEFARPNFTTSITRQTTL